MDARLVIQIFEFIGAVFAVTGGAAAAAYAQSKVIAQACESMSRQPGLSNDLRFTMIIGLAMIESLAIYCLLIALILLFVKW